MIKVEVFGDQYNTIDFFRVGGKEAVKELEKLTKQPQGLYKDKEL